MLYPLLDSLIFAQAQGAPAKGQAPSGPFTPEFMIMIALIMVMFYFLMWLPNRKRERERKNMLASLKKNDHVVTAGGIKGIVANVKDDEVVIKIDETTGAKLRVVPSSITQVIAADEDASAAKKES